MDRDLSEPTGVLTANATPNGRKNSIPPFGNKHAPRRSSAKAESKENVGTDRESPAGPRPSRSCTHKLHKLHHKTIIEATPSPRCNRSHSGDFSSPRASQSPRDTRLPRPKTTTPTAATAANSNRNTQIRSQQQSDAMRQPMDVKAAFKRAQEQEAEAHGEQPNGTIDMKQAFAMARREANGGGVDGSPSPAPRTYNPRPDSYHSETNGGQNALMDIKRAFALASAEAKRAIEGSPSPVIRPENTQRRSYSTVSQRTLGSGRDSDLGHHLEQFDRNHQLNGGNGPLEGLFGKNRIGPKVSETGHALAKKASNGSLGSSPESRRASQRRTSIRSKENENVIGRSGSSADGQDQQAGEDVPLPSIEDEPASNDQPSPSAKPVHPSPEKSYNWHLDADFTAGDLQVSQSPRVRTGKAQERPTSSHSSPPAPSTPNFRRSNTRLDEIREREAAAAKATFPEDEVPPPKRTNSRLDEIRALEVAAISKRAVASSRLDEIRIKNSEARSVSPEMVNNSSKEDLRGGSLQVDNESAEPPKSIAEPEAESQLVPDTPVAISSNISDEKVVAPEETEKPSPTHGDNNPSSSPKKDSQDLLRRLARATSSSPPSSAGEQQTKNKTEEKSPRKAEEKTGRQGSSDMFLPKKEPEETESSRPRSKREERRSRILGIKSSRERPTVGFVGLRRALSSDSIQEKRLSLATSEMDPTDRIEAEMNLFAPMDNYSEKGSMRAPSPVPSEPDEEATPRRNRVDPMTLPTPRVTGAYVETPATVKVKQEDASKSKAIHAPEIGSAVRTRSSSRQPRAREIKKEASGNPKLSRVNTLRSSSDPTTSRRARSLSRRRRPLINTANPPSVKDDIRAILRMNEIDDSTLDDFDSILAKHEIDDEELEQMVSDTVLKIEDDIDFPKLTDRERELQAYDRMSHSLKTGLLGIRSAKKGIERLEDKVTHTEQMADPALTDLGVSSSKFATRVSFTPANSTAVTITIPSLYRKNPKFRLTTFGLLTLALALWYALESAFCFLYAAPQYECSPEAPCDWSPDEPYFPYTMPFMLDEWATGGKCRALTWRIGEEAGDIMADVSDWVTNTDFTRFDQRYMDVWERKRHRRRLRKHGLIPKWIEPPDYKPRFAEWHAARLAREAATELGHDTEDETMEADEMIG